MRKTVFISDIHLQENQPKIARLFLNFLNKCRDKIDALYILGDLFEAWIGDDDYSHFHQMIIQALKSLTQSGIPIFFLHGNRDFLIGKKFFAESGLIGLSEQEIVSLYGSTVLLMHGDTLCTRDVSYLKFRKKIRNPLVTKFFLILPLLVRKKIVTQLRNKSQRYTQNIPLEMMDVTQEEVERVMQKNQVQFLIHGHTHRPDCHEFNLNRDIAQRIVLGAWHDSHSKILIWDEAGTKKLIPLDIF